MQTENKSVFRVQIGIFCPNKRFKSILKAVLKTNKRF